MAHELGKKPRIACTGACERYLAINPQNFFKSSRKEHKSNGGYLPICKKCINETLVDEVGRVTVERFKAILAQLDVVFIPKLFTEAIQRCKGEPSKMVGEYRALLNITREYKHCTYNDSIRFEEQAEKEKKVPVSEEMMEFWGYEIKDKKEYFAYQKLYDTLCIQDGGEVIGVKQEYFKQISMLTYKSQQQLLSNQMTDYKKSLEALTTVCEKCGINPKQIQDKDDTTRGTYGTFIKMIEEEEPIEDWNKMMGSIDVVKKILQVFFFGHLAQVSEMRNPLKCDYDEVMKEYSVTIDDYDDFASIEEIEEEVEHETIGRRILKAVKIDGKWRKK